VLFDDLVVRESDPLAVDFSIPALVDEFADRLLVGVTVCDKGLDN
jgi:hypothetical protein